MTYAPRPYQLDFIAGIREAWRSGAQRVAGVMATGGGKTVVFSELADPPMLIIAHRTELIDQAIAKAQKQNPHLSVGRMQGPVKQWRSDIVVGSVQTCSRPGALKYLAARRWELVVCDECHHISAASYQTILNEVGAFRPGGPRLLGVTATLNRGDGLSLGDTFEVVAEPQIGLIDLVRQGWLVRPRGIRVKIRDLETDTVGRVAGDFNQGRLGAAMHAAMAPQKLVAAWEEHAKGRPTIAFMPTVAISQEVADAFRAAGHRFVHLSDKTPKRDRAAILDAYRRGEVTGLCNVGLFSEGTDLPTTECVIVKMTMSSVSYQQQVGRGLRLHDPADCECPIQPCAFPLKCDCVILDPSGVAKRHTLATLVSLAGAPAEGDIPDELLMYEEDDEPVEKAEEVYDAPPPEYEDGDALDHELFDLFGQSETTWLRTNGGTWFVSVPSGFLFLRRPERDAEWSLCWHVEDTSAPGLKQGVIAGDLSLEAALEAGDAYIAARPMWQAQRDAPWRQTARGLRSDAQAVTRASELLDT
jgi:superfamily II DNA or RNA helicase